MDKTKFVAELPIQMQDEIFRRACEWVADRAHISWEDRLQFLQDTMNSRLCDALEFTDESAITIEDMFTEKFSEQYGDVDITNNVFDGFAPAFCGPMALKEDGVRTYKDVLDIPIRIHQGEDGYIWVECLLDIGLDDEELDRINSRIYDLFNSAAGYCSEEEWDKWFEYLD